MHALDRLSIVANIDELKQSLRIAYELRECIVVNQDCADGEICAELSNHSRYKQMQLAQHFQDTLTALQILVIDCVHDRTLISGNELERIAKVAVELQDDLALFVAVVKQAEIEQERLNNEYIKQDDKSTTFEEPVAFVNEVAGERQATETIIPVMSVVLEEVIVLEDEIPQRDDEKQNANIVSVALELIHTIDKTTPDRLVTVSGAETVAAQSEELVPIKTVHELVNDELGQFGTAVKTDIQIAQCEVVERTATSEVIPFSLEEVIPVQVTVAGMLHIYTNNILLI